MNPNNGFTPPLQEYMTLPSGEVALISNIRYDGSSDFGDYYVGTSPSGGYVRWAIPPGSYSVTDFLEGSIGGDGFTSAQLTRRISTPADITPAMLSRPVASSPEHVWVKTENGRDFWRQNYNGGVYTWQTPVGATSGAIITETYAFAPGATTPGDAPVTPPLTVAGPTPSNQVTGSNQGGGGPNGSASGGLVRAVPPADAGPRSSTAHVYVGRDARGDVWQIFDGTNVLEWAVDIGDPSAALIEGTLRNLGAPSAGTVAQAAPSVVPSTPAAKAVEDAKGTLWLSAAAIAAKILIFS